MDSIHTSAHTVKPLDTTRKRVYHYTSGTNAARMKAGTMTTTLTPHQTYRAEVIELRAMNEWSTYSAAQRIALEVLATVPDDAKALQLIARRLRSVVLDAAAMESNRREAAATLATVRHEIASYFVAERHNF